MSITALRVISLPVFVFCGFAMFASGLIVTGEAYHFMQPDIDTQFTSMYEEERFQNISNGISKDSVLSLIGEPLTIESASDSIFDWIYSHDGKCNVGDYAWLLRGVTINRQGRVVKKTSVVIHD